MDAMAVSGALLPLASGVVEASCDRKLGGTSPGIDAWRCGGFLGVAGIGTTVTEDGDDKLDGIAAGVSACGAETGGATAVGESAVLGPAVGCAVALDGACGCS